MLNPCGNNTNIDNACSNLLKYCKNNYVNANGTEWCNCIDNNYDDECDIDYVIAICISASVIVFLICFILYEYYKCKNKQIPSNKYKPNISNI